MSVESIAIALHHSQAKGTAKIVLLGIANHDGDGGAWPSVATLARYAGVDLRNAQRAIEKLVDLGEIRVGYQMGGTARTPAHLRPNLYVFSLACPSYCDRSARHRDIRKPLFEYAPEPDALNLSTGVAVAPPGGGSATGGDGGSATRTIL
ncbi:helix-turn-helix domain-containing protein [Humibacter ginsenosidimutans]|uniref:Helix-turn-helix domain-containing protein n=1 Tax=Humibacter ginsenosidimutans TaxID=2599293 RepID=A0A5B8M0N6_9MICO|nr:helix-turn-helix domain-containing protein [Humibacter ginsenosidimutans]QDZ14237.1 helix-turn-helix domain-containing protein [Humibacter ginsenosidimutans]